MAYDNFENTPFDLDHDGHIDSNEAAYIYETFFNEDNVKDDSSFDEDNEDYEEDEDGEFSYEGGYISQGNSVNIRMPRNQALENMCNGKTSDGKTMQELRDESFRRTVRKHSIIMTVAVVAWEFLGGYYGTGIIAAIIILSFGFWITSDK